MDFKDLYKELQGAMGNSDISKEMGSLINTGANIMGSAYNNVIGGGLSSGIGDTATNIGNTIGGAVSIVNPVLGGAITLGSDILGGTFNRMFGSKINTENVDRITTGINSMNNAVLGTDYNTLLGQWGSQNLGSNFSRKDIGSDGWFSNKVKKLYKTLSYQQDTARNRFLTNYNNSIDDVNTMNLRKLQATQFKNGGLMNTFDLGGLVSLGSTDFPVNDTVNTGGTHEENPNGGVAIGYDNNGVPNMLEQGEVVIKGITDGDYVASNRLTLDKDFAKKYKLPQDMTYADAAKKMMQPLKDNPNDPITKRTVDFQLAELIQAQEITKAKKDSAAMKRQINKLDPQSQAALLSNALQGQQEQQNPQDGQQQGGDEEIAAEGQEMASQQAQDAQTTQDVQNAEMPSFMGAYGGLLRTNRFDEGGYTFDMNKARQSLGNSSFDYFVPLGNLSPYASARIPKHIEYTPKSNKNDSYVIPDNPLRYAGVLGSSLGIANGLLSKPNLTPVNNILRGVRETGNYIPVSYTPVANVYRNKYFDRNYYTNQLLGQSNANARTLVNNSNGNLGLLNASLLANNFNTISQLGDLQRKAEEADRANDMQAISYNTDINKANSQGNLQAAMANQQAAANNSRGMLSGLMAAEQLRQNILDKRSASMSANLTNLFNNLAAIGNEQVSRKELARLIASNVFGTLNDYYKK